MDGIDPLEVKQAAREAPTVKDGLDRFFDDFAPQKIRIGRMKESTLTEYRRQSTANVEPSLGGSTSIRCGKRTLSGWFLRLPRTQRNRVIAFTQRLFNFFIEKGLRNSANPCLDIERAKEEPRERVISASEISLARQGTEPARGTTPRVRRSDPSRGTDWVADRGDYQN